MSPITRPSCCLPGSSTAADFRFPEGLTGSFPVRFSADTPLGHVETTETVQLEDKVSVLLTSEKPIYQPSQTIHLRALALDRADQHAAAGRDLTFEVKYPRGNKVFRKSTATDNFGVASAEFTLADEDRIQRTAGFIGASHPCVSLKLLSRMQARFSSDSTPGH